MYIGEYMYLNASHELISLVREFIALHRIMQQPLVILTDVVLAVQRADMPLHGLYNIC